MILLIDSYDSFSNNLRRLLETNSGKKVVTIFNDTFSRDEYQHAYDSWIKHFDYIVVGPGPGHPEREADVGIVKWLFQHFAAYPSECIPVLGVCLGFQSMCYEFGNPVVRLNSIKHGQVYKVTPYSSSLFGSSCKDLEAFESVRYHSLHVDLATLNKHIIPLADCDENDGSQRKLLMAARHASLPLFGVQYHPESICSNKGDDLVKRFSALAHSYNSEHRPELADLQNETWLASVQANAMKDHTVHEDVLIPEGFHQSQEAPIVFAQKFSPHDRTTSPIDVCNDLSSHGQDFILLNSAADPGEWSIIGLLIPGHTEIITHSLDERTKVKISVHKTESPASTQTVESMWQFLAARMAEHYIDRATLDKQLGALQTRRFPFLGGYMGMISYEEGKHLDHSSMRSFCTESTPDTKLAFIERFILFDHKTNEWFLVSLRGDIDKEFCTDLIGSYSSETHLKINKEDVPRSAKAYLSSEDKKIMHELPSQKVYEQQFGLCQEYLHSGDSYELCLTTQSKVHVPRYVSAWDIYKVLAIHRNPSPYSSYMDFEDCTLISSSPERFLSWTDSTQKPGRKIAELRPIKGTVKNTESVTLADATQILRTPKEMGENMMIVDLIRHDLQSFTDDVSVDALMTVEEYKTVYQLVSVIRGHLPEAGFKGIDILKSSLPPGSMTGAPKKRSVQLLQKIEELQPTMAQGGRRGFYAGVAGYWSVTDDADWSVNIRSMVHYKQDEENSDKTNVWRIGAGGAITVLSERESEWEEMHLKLLSTLQIFS